MLIMVDAIIMTETATAAIDRTVKSDVDTVIKSLCERLGAGAVFTGRIHHNKIWNPTRFHFTGLEFRISTSSTAIDVAQVSTKIYKTVTVISAKEPTAAQPSVVGPSATAQRRRRANRYR